MKSTYPWLSVFDLDDTLISTNSSLQFTRYLMKRGLLSKRSMLSIYILYCIFKICPIALPILHRLAFKAAFQGQDIKYLSAQAEKFWEANLGAWVYKELGIKLEEAKRQGHYTVLLSNSPDFFVQIAAKKMGFKYCRGSLYHLKNHKLHKVDILMGGAEKAKTLRSLCTQLGISRKHTSAYTDCISDLALLEAAADSTAVNPKGKLKKFCKQNNWKIILTAL